VDREIRVFNKVTKRKLHMPGAEQKTAEIFSICVDPSFSETGGAHAQKGIDFQRFWAMVRIFKLTEAGVPDFLILFESIQDVAELDSETEPNSIDIYQIKKKDSGEWSFNSLTGLPKPDGRKKKVPAKPSAITDSPIGKLYRAGLAFKYLQSRIHFVSNAGCDLPLAAGGAISKHLSCSVEELDEAHTSALKESLALLQSNPADPPDLKKLKICKTTLHPDDPAYFVLGVAVDYLSKNMVLHAGQAKALVEALYMQISALGRQTEVVNTFAELRRQRGFSKKDMDVALDALSNIPDLKKYFDMMLDGLSQEGLPLIRKISVNVAATRYFSNLVAGTMSDEDYALIEDCITVANRIDYDEPIFQTLEAEVKKMEPVHVNFKGAEILAFLLIQVTKHATS
jgi:hypothetical protein